jgi:hypothetical protein
VFANGRYLDRRALDEMLRAASRAIATEAPPGNGR